MSWGVDELSVSFDGHIALDGVTLALPPGRVTAVVGGDGAGKTTLLRVLGRRLLPSRGAVHLPDRSRVSYLPARAGGFRDLTVAENLEFVAAACRIADADRRTAVLLERTGLAPFRRRLARDLSGGMRQKLGVIMALLPEPALLILDEPTTGIDPVSRADLWHLMARAAVGGAAVAVSSAYLDEAERAAWLLVLHGGRPLLAGPPDRVRASLPGSVVEVDTPGDLERSWRRGSRWREWCPEGDRAGIEPTLEDVVIAAALAADEGSRP